MPSSTAFEQRGECGAALELLGAVEPGEVLRAVGRQFVRSIEVVVAPHGERALEALCTRLYVHFVVSNVASDERHE